MHVTRARTDRELTHGRGWPWTAVAHARCLVSTSTPAPKRFAAPFAAQALVNHPDRGGDRVEFELMVLAFETLQHVDIARAELSGSSAAPGHRPRIDVYDSPRRIRPQRASTTCCAPRWVARRSDRPAVGSRRGALGAGAREAIRETVARYAHYADSGQFAELAALFAVDGVLEIHGERRSRAAPRSASTSTAWRRSQRVERRADAPPPRVEPHDHRRVTDARRRGACYFLALTEHGVDHWGRYRDRFVPGDGGWLFAHRSRAHRRLRARRLGRRPHVATVAALSPRRPRAAGTSRTTLRSP